MSEKWRKTTVQWNREYWQDALDGIQACIAYTDCPCGEWIRVAKIGELETCPACGRQFRVVVERSLEMHTPVDIAYPPGPHGAPGPEGGAGGRA
jgi:ssDNA-binding Zn-finger/Zn-ribbon topoisomerase 1